MTDQGSGLRRHLVSRICGVDEVVDSFLGRDGGPYPYVWLDGDAEGSGGRPHRERLRGGGDVNAEGHEVLGMDVGTSEDGAFWLAFLRSLTARGLSGVELVT